MYSHIHLLCMFIILLWQVGIESTVAKILPETNQLLIYRRGGVSEHALHQVLNGVFDPPIEILTAKKVAPDEEHQEAPGQLLTHYAPDVESYLVQTGISENSLRDMQIAMKQWVVVDFNGRLAHIKTHVKEYLDLSPAYVSFFFFMFCPYMLET